MMRVKCHCKKNGASASAAAATTGAITWLGVLVSGHHSAQDAPQSLISQTSLHLTYTYCNDPLLLLLLLLLL